MLAVNANVLMRLSLALGLDSAWTRRFLSSTRITAWQNASRKLETAGNFYLACSAKDKMEVPHRDAVQDKEVVAEVTGQTKQL